MKGEGRGIMIKDNPSFVDRSPFKVYNIHMIKSLIASILLCLSVGAIAGPVAAFTDQSGVTFTVYSEDCPLKQVDLGNKATVQEGKNIIPACVGYVPEFDVVVLFNTKDKGIYLIPRTLFKPVVGI